MGAQVSSSKVERWYPSLTTEMANVEKPSKKMRYGTAGFRDKAEILDSTVLRMGILAALRSRGLGLPVAVMVTASHNPGQDNGLKIVDPDGGMLDQKWEAYAEMLANAPWQEVTDVLAKLFVAESIPHPPEGEAVCCAPVQGPLPDEDKQEGGGGRRQGQGQGQGQQGSSSSAWGGVSVPLVLLARDTREHSPRLASLVKKGVELVEGKVRDLGILTTPQLHHAVRIETGKSFGKVGEKWVGTAWGRPEWEGEAGYYRMVGQAYNDLVATGLPTNSKGKRPSWQDIKRRSSSSWDALLEVAGVKDQTLYVDAACGVGGPQVLALVKAALPTLRLEVRNGVGHGMLNEGCGAEFVQKGVKPPRGVDKETDRGKTLCSFDGDADRIVFHYFDKEGEWTLADGDKIAALLAGFLGEEMGVLALDSKFSLACVQTAYANGASTAYLKSKSIKTVITKTGVKYLHHEAVKYDVGVYFEANGHGTVLFSERIKKEVGKLGGELEEIDLGEAETGANGQEKEKEEDEEEEEEEKKEEEEKAAKKAKAEATAERQQLAVRRLSAVMRLANQATGDAICDMLLVAAVLGLRGWGMPEWCAMYTELPSRQAKLAVKDRTVVQCSEDEAHVVQPVELQIALDAATRLFSSGRCFVRPSGTEDVVRVYAEAETKDLADQLALCALQAVHAFAGGLGDPPRSL